MSSPSPSPSIPAAGMATPSSLGATTSSKGMDAFMHRLETMVRRVGASLEGPPIPEPNDKIPLDCITFFSFVCSSLFIAQLSSRVSGFRTVLATEVLKLIIIAPKTSTCKALQDPRPLKLIQVQPADSAADIVTEIQRDPNLTIKEVEQEVIPVVNTLYKSKHSFFLDSMDAVIISKFGVNVLIIKFPNRGYDRSLFVDLTGYRLSYLRVSNLIAIVAGTVVTAVTNRESFRRLVSDSFNRIFRT
jgi:hypothetical protein